MIRNDAGDMQGVEAVIDKDRTAALLAQAMDADVLLMLTDVAAVMRDWGAPNEPAFDDHATRTHWTRWCLWQVPWGPKIAPATAFVRDSGGLAGIGTMQDAHAVLEARSNTRISPEPARGEEYQKERTDQSGSVHA